MLEHHEMRRPYPAITQTIMDLIENDTTSNEPLHGPPITVTSLCMPQKTDYMRAPARSNIPCTMTFP